MEIQVANMTHKLRAHARQSLLVPHGHEPLPVFFPTRALGLLCQASQFVDERSEIFATGIDQCAQWRAAAFVEHGACGQLLQRQEKAFDIVSGVLDVLGCVFEACEDLERNLPGVETEEHESENAGGLHRLDEP